MIVQVNEVMKDGYVELQRVIKESKSLELIDDKLLIIGHGLVSQLRVDGCWRE
jgi:hypothetical protein